MARGEATLEVRVVGSAVLVAQALRLLREIAEDSAHVWLPGERELVDEALEALAREGGLRAEPVRPTDVTPKGEG